MAGGCRPGGRKAASKLNGRSQANRAWAKWSEHLAQDGNETSKKRRKRELSSKKENKQKQTWGPHDGTKTCLEIKIAAGEMNIYILYR